MQLEQKNKQIEQQKIKLEKTKLEKELLHLCTFRPTKIYIRTLKGADINFVGNSLKDYKPQVRFVIFNGIKRPKYNLEKKNIKKQSYNKVGYGFLGFPFLML